jgi:hypothetical protein
MSTASRRYPNNFFRAKGIDFDTVASSRLDLCSGAGVARALSVLASRSKFDRPYPGARRPNWLIPVVRTLLDTRLCERVKGVGTSARATPKEGSVYLNLWGAGQGFTGCPDSDLTAGPAKKIKIGIDTGMAV